MNLDARTASLMAVAASVAANCQPCLETNALHALRCGADAGEIADAVAVGSKIRTGAGARMDAFAASLDLRVRGDADAEVKCGCGS